MAVFLYFVSHGGLLRCLVVAMQLDDQSAAEKDVGLVAAYPALRRFAFVLADGDLDPEDLLHETLVRILARGSTTDIEHLEAFARRTMTHVRANRRRSLGRRRRMLERLQEAPDVVEPSVAGNDLGDLLAVGPTDRAILYLFIVEGRPHVEIAEIVGLSEDATRARYSRALKRLRVKTRQEAIRGDR